MTCQPRLNPLVLAILVTTLACGDDDDLVGDKPDTSPPSISSVTAIDRNHIDVTFSESIDRTSAEGLDHYTIIETTRTATSIAPDDTLHVNVAVLKADGRTVALTTHTMSVAPYIISVDNVEDVSGNVTEAPVVMSFDGSTDADVTPAEIAFRSPAADASDVLIVAPIVIQFSEPMSVISIFDGLSLTSSSGEVDYSVHYESYERYEVRPLAPLELDREYTVVLNDALDEADNAMSATWSFRTAREPDETAPTLVASTPADLSVNVDVDTDLSFTFSEAMRERWPISHTSPHSLALEGSWVNEGKTFRMRLASPLNVNVQYLITIDADDLSGNSMNPVAIRFTTGDQIGRGVISGKLIGNGAVDFDNAFVIAQHSDGTRGGWDRTGSDGVYEIRYLPNDDYSIHAYVEANGNPDDLTPFEGDAAGTYGTNPPGNDFSWEWVLVRGANGVIGRNFPVIDFSAITGLVEYDGIYAGEEHDVVVGLFDVATYDPAMPDYTYPSSLDLPDFVFASYYVIPPAGTFYLGAYVDSNDSGTYDPGIDPVGYYGGGSLTEIAIANGSDVNGIQLVVEDPVPGAETGAAITWTVREPMGGESYARLAKLARSLRPGNVPRREMVSSARP